MRHGPAVGPTRDAVRTREQVQPEAATGRHTVQREQIRRLRRCAELPFRGLHIMPTDREAHAGPAGPTVLLGRLRRRAPTRETGRCRGSRRPWTSVRPSRRRHRGR
ncbi:Scr1 family TA system antitoxin-like transcriptional regulator [Streptomyces sp. NPDC005283]|uniref:Scr1 family TA system antitoxin-like transcriptional regulator n=1 Tax=Streptomyces sp. NPDC005283 TaxID=3156871 RepID=UPI0034521CFB